MANHLHTVDCKTAPSTNPSSDISHTFFLNHILHFMQVFLKDHVCLWVGENTKSVLFWLLVTAAGAVSFFVSIFKRQRFCPANKWLKPSFSSLFQLLEGGDVGQLTKPSFPLISLLILNADLILNITFKNTKVLNDGKQEKGGGGEVPVLFAKEIIGNIQVKVQIYRKWCFGWPESEGRRKRYFQNEANSE